ncbi:hypothetical protein [Novosphingobium aquimarinum]|nr:hypothetical protein [Novosphingobium aquimarinum]
MENVRPHFLVHGWHWTGLHRQISHELHGADGDETLQEAKIHACGV